MKIGQLRKFKVPKNVVFIINKNNYFHVLHPTTHGPPTHSPTHPPTRLKTVRRHKMTFT